jgi:hypothetical protein
LSNSTIPRVRAMREAEQLIVSERNQRYGNPVDNFGTIAELWTAYLSRRFGITIPIDTADVAVMSALIKISRIAHDPAYEDNYIDLIGYAACGAEVASSTVATTGLDIEEVQGWLVRAEAEIEEILSELGEVEGNT